MAVAVSGGADSVALLRVLLELRAELGIVLAVAHFNHGLRGEQATADEAFVGELAKAHSLEFIVGRGNVRDYAVARKIGTEAAARALRYQWLAGIAQEQRFDCVATAHTADDQAETVLLKLIRGAGTRGLAGIYPILLQCEQAQGGPHRFRVVRPLLCVSRAEVQAYLTSMAQLWREDETNLDRRFLRNRVRHELLPLLMRDYNPGIRQVLSDLGELSRAEEEYWQTEVERELAALAPAGSAREPGTIGVPCANSKDSTLPGQVPDFRIGRQPERLNLRRFRLLPAAMQRRLLKRFSELQGLTLDFEDIEALRRCALGEVTRTELPGGRIARQSGGWLQVCTSGRETVVDYRCLLPIPGEVHIAALGLTVQALTVAEEFAREMPGGDLLSCDLLGPELVVRNWHPGDRFWPAHSRSGEKLKRLFAERRVPPAERHGWTVALHGSEIVWVRDFPVAQAYRWNEKGVAVRIQVL